MKAIGIKIGLTVPSTTPYVIAEVGHNHQGNLGRCKEMFMMAKWCGADAVKLQKRDNKSLYTADLYNSPYENENSYGKTYGEHREALEFGRDEYVELKNYADEIGIDFFATAFDFGSADFLEDIGLPAYKIASGDLRNTPLLRHIASKGKPIFLSTGGAALDDVRRAYDTIMLLNSNLCIMQCTAAYPVDPKDMNLRVIETYIREFPDITVGLSDHQNGIAMAVVAYVLGARVFEKHFTLNRSWKGTDHAFSLEPTGFRKLVRDLERARQALGDGDKRILPCEEKPILKMSKKIVASRELPSGHVLGNDDIALKSPGDGLPPYEIENILGRALKVALYKDENIDFDKLT